MSTSPSERRLIKNEFIFKNANLKVYRALERLKKTAQLEGFTPLTDTDDVPLHFYCECSDKNCKDRIIMKPSVFTKHHKTERHFVILPGHETLKVEKVTLRRKHFIVVEKFHVKVPV